MSWSRSLGGFADEVEKSLTQRQKDMAAYGLQQLVVTSPVDQGTYKANHRVTVNGVTGDYSLNMQDEGGQRTIMEGMEVIGSISRPFGTVTIQNNIPYGQRLEDGWSDQGSKGDYYANAAKAVRERFK